MRRVLIVLTEEAQSVTALFQQAADAHVETVDLRRAEPDYNLLLDKIFEAESVQIW